MENDRIKQALARLRVELYTAAQVLTGEDLEELRQLISEIQAVLDHSHPFQKVGPV